MKKRIWHQVPAPWRKRIEPLAKIADDIQRQLEVLIGWRKKYQRRFVFGLDLSEKDIEMVALMLRFICPDLVGNIEVRHDIDGFDTLARGVIMGKTPKLKRIKLPPETI